MNFLYTITIYPLELAYRYLYLFCVEITGSYGIALFALAIVSTLIYTPLKKIASKAQDKERRIQEVMAPQIEAIKQESSGSLQHQRISKLYYRYSYHPIFALRSIIGVALQVPFLCAAYYMLSTLSQIQGHSFGVIADLSKPDALLFGTVNALPLLMTFFNIVATYASTNFSRKEQLQAVVVALAFLVLLYNAPSALLIYWTANNALLCFQALWSYKKTNTNKNKKAERSKNKLKIKAKIKKPLYIRIMRLLLSVLTIFFIFSFIILVSYLTRDPNETLVNSASIIIFAFIPIALFLRQKNNQELRTIKLVILNSLLLILFFNFIRIIDSITIPVLNWSFNKLELKDLDNLLIITAIVSWLFLSPINKFSRLKHTIKIKKFFAKAEKSLYFSAAGTLGLLIIFFSPTALYLSSPDFFQDSLTSLLLDVLPYAIGYLVTVTLIWLISPAIIKSYLTLIIIFITIVVLINALLLNGDYGALDGLLFNNLEYFGSAWTVVFDLIAISIATALIVIVSKYKLSSQLITGFNLATCSMIVFCLFNLYKASSENTKIDNIALQQNGALPDYNDRLYGFSETENNVLIFVLDMFTAGDVPLILEKHPELKRRYSGFTWYEDTIAVGSSTVLSTPSIYAGPAYTLPELNKRPEIKNSRKMAESLSVITNQFNRHNYDVSILETPISVSRETIDEYLDKDILFIPKLEAVYTHRWMEKLNIPKIESSNMSHYMLAISLFRVAPHKIKRNIYRDWQWFGVGNALFSNQNLYNTLSNTAYFALLPEVANNRSKKGTLKFFYNLLPHYPWHLPENSLVPVLDPYPETQGSQIKVDGHYPEHYYTEQHLLIMLADFFDWMKKNNIYDNSLIILVSDHDSADSIRLIFENKPLEKWARPHALLMVKNFNQQGELKISDDLMATDDVAAIICPTINGCEGVEPLKTNPQRARKHYMPIDKRNADFYDSIIRYDEYTITGTMFDENNWELKRYQE